MNSTETTKRDIMIECSECGEEFTWTVNDQEFYAQMAFERPKRCRPCRQKRKSERRTAPSDR